MNTKQSFTPGPWIVELANAHLPTEHQFWMIVKDDVCGFRDAIAHIPTLGEKIRLEDEANARLIACAHRMFEALVGIAYGIKTCGHNFTCICNQVKAEAIIAEIEGEGYRNAWKNQPDKNGDS